MTVVVSTTEKMKIGDVLYVEENGEPFKITKVINSTTLEVNPNVSRWLMLLVFPTWLFEWVFGRFRKKSPHIFKKCCSLKRWAMGATPLLKEFSVGFWIIILELLIIVWILWVRP